MGIPLVTLALEERKERKDFSVGKGGRENGLRCGEAGDKLFDLFLDSDGEGGTGLRKFGEEEKFKRIRKSSLCWHCRGPALVCWSVRQSLKKKKEDGET